MKWRFLSGHICLFVISLSLKLTLNMDRWKVKLLVWEAGTVWVQSDQCSEHLGWGVSTLDGNALWFISPSYSVCVCVCVCVSVLSRSVPSNSLQPCGPYPGFPGGTSGKESACQCRRCKRRGFDPWVGKIPWRRAWQPTPVFLPGKSHGQRSLVGYSP